LPHKNQLSPFPLQPLPEAHLELPEEARVLQQQKPQPCAQLLGHINQLQLGNLQAGHRQQLDSMTTNEKEAAAWQSAGKTFKQQPNSMTTG
jgi:hypothetical protein